MYIIFSALGNNWQESDWLIPQSLKSWGPSISGNPWETWRCRRKMDKTKTWWKTEREKKNITSDGRFWNCLKPTWLIILHMSLCFRDGCLSATVTEIAMRVSLFLLSTEGIRHRNMSSTALHIDKDVALLGKDLWNAYKLRWKYLNSIAIDIWDAHIQAFLMGEALLWKRGH